MEIRNIIRSLIEEKLSESSNSLNDVVWSKNVIKPGTKTSVTKKYKAGDKVKYAGKILTVVSHDDNGFITLSNPEWSKNRIVPHTAVSSIKESLEEEDTKEVINEQFNTEKGEAKEINDKKYIGLNLMWSGKKFGEVYPHRATSQTKRAGSKIASTQKSVVRWGYRVPGIQTGRYDITSGFSSRDEAAQAALKLYKKNIEESLDEDAKALFQKIKKHAANLGDKFVQGALHGATFGMMGHDTHDPLTGNTYDKVKPFSNRNKKRKMKESLDEASDRKLDKAMAIINARITKPGQPPKYPSFDSAPEDIKAAAKNLAKNMK